MTEFSLLGLLQYTLNSLLSLYAYHHDVSFHSNWKQPPNSTDPGRPPSTYLNNFFFGNSLIDILFTHAFVPKMMNDYLLPKTIISTFHWGTQIFLGLALGGGGTECILFGLVSYNWYVAICKPLHYLLLMNWHLYRLMAVSSWTSGTFNALIHTVYTMKFPFGGSREINHFYRELPIVLCLSYEVLGLWDWDFDQHHHSASGSILSHPSLLHTHPFHHYPNGFCWVLH